MRFKYKDWNLEEREWVLMSLQRELDHYYGNGIINLPRPVKGAMAVDITSISPVELTMDDLDKIVERAIRKNISLVQAMLGLIPLIYKKGVLTNDTENHE